MARSVDERKRAEWRARFERFRQAAMSVTRFCRDEGVSVPGFYQWRKKLAGPVNTEPAARFAAVRLIGVAHVAAVLPGGIRLEIPLGDARAMQIAIETLVRADAERAGGERC